MQINIIAKNRKSKFNCLLIKNNIGINEKKKEKIVVTRLITQVHKLSNSLNHNQLNIINVR